MAPTPLTDYEASQVQAIAAWKGEMPGLSKRAFRAVAAPIGKLMNKVLPKGAVSAAMDMVNKMAGQLAKDDTILKDSWLKERGITSLEDIAAQPLEFADELAGRIIRDANNIALGMGAATGTGGPIAVAVELPALVVGALRVIYRISQAYGYAVDDPGDKELMLHILALSTASGPGERAEAMANYQRQIETTFLHQAVEESANKAIQRVVLGAELGALIPGFSIAFSAYLNREFVNRAGLAAQRVFQEHWLRERGKVEWVDPISS
jgi:hypothetical protein